MTDSIKNQFLGSTLNNAVFQYGDRKIPRALTSSPSLSEVFLGRADEMKAIRERFVSGQNLLLLVNGTGGVGKTTLAAQYYHRFQPEYAHTAWVLSGFSMTDSLLDLAGPLGLQFEPAMPSAERLLILLREMAELNRPCLLVIDNANDARELEKNYQHLRRCSNFHLLLTSRITEFEAAQTFRIEGLPEPEAIELFQKYYPNFQPTELAILKQIRTAVGANTLVLELLAKNLARFNRLKTSYTLADLLADLQKKGFLHLSKSQPVSTDYQSHGGQMRHETPEAIIAAMYDLSDLPEAERGLLSVFAVLPSENIGFNWLEILLPDHPDLENALLPLAQNGWIDFDETDRAFKCHPVVQEITRLKNEERLWADCERLVYELNEKLDYEGTIGHLLNATYDEGAVFARFAEAVVAGFDKPESAISLLCERVGSYFYATGNLNRAFFFSEKKIKICEALCTAEPENADFKNILAISHQNLGMAHTSAGDLTAALSHFETFNCLENELRQAFPQNVDFKNNLAVSHLKLGNAHTSTGDLTAALPHFEKFNRLENELCEAFPQNVAFKNGLAISHQYLGNAHTSAGDLTAALLHYEKCNRLENELHEAFPQKVEFKNGLAISHQNLGDAHTSAGDLTAALSHFEKFNRLENELHEAFPQNVGFKNGLAISHQYLGDAHTSAGDLTAALPHFETYNRLENELHEAFPLIVEFKTSLAVSHSQLGCFYRDQKNDRPQARLHFEQCYQLLKELSEEHPAVAVFQTNFREAKNDLESL